MDGREYQVIGIFDEKNSAFNSSYDHYVLIPVSTFLSIYGFVDDEGFSRS